MRLESTINPRKIGVMLALVAAYLAAQSLIVEFVEDRVANSGVSLSFILAIDLFSVNAEQTIPTWFSVAILLVTAVLLGTITTAKHASQDRYTRYWAVLAVGFLYMSIDEGAVIHEVLADWIQEEFHFTGYLAFGWQVVAVPLVIVVGLLYLRFLFQLPPRTRYRFIAAGALYVTGAVLLDAVSAKQFDTSGSITFRYLTIGTLEELFEMMGVVVMIYALLSYIVEMDYTFVFHSPMLAQDTPEPAQHHPATLEQGLRDTLRSVLRQRAVLGGVLVMVALNLTLLYWASARESDSPSAALNPAISVPVMLDQLVTDDVVVIRMPGRFIDNPASHQVVAALLPQFDEVVVVTSASTGSSFALAADHLPFDRNRLAEVLQANGETQFMIFDTPAVKAIVGTLQTWTQGQ